MPWARGRIVLVQEQSFRLLSSGGRALQLTLGVKARPFPAELARYRDNGTEVEVEYEGEPGTASGKALTVQPV